MGVQSILAASTTLLSLASAYLAGISVPDTIKPGDSFDLILKSQIYIQSVYDVAVAVGVSPQDGYPGSLYNVLGSYYIGPHASSSSNGDVTKRVTLPDDTEKGPAYITAGLMSLWGAAYDPSITHFNVSVTIGDVTSTNYVTGGSFYI